MKKGIRGCLGVLFVVALAVVLVWFFKKTDTGGDLLARAAQSFQGESALYELDDADGFSGEYPVLTGDIPLFCPGEGIGSLDFSLGACQLKTAVSEDGNIYLEAQNAGKLQAYVEDGVLYLAESASAQTIDGLGSCCITFFVPEGAVFDQVRMELGAGSLVLDTLSASSVYFSAGAGEITAAEVSAQELEVYVGAGKMEIDRMDVSSFLAKVGMGELEAKGRLTGSGSIDCTMGKVSLILEGSRTAYDYRITGTMGKITVDGESYTGVSKTEEIDNGAGRWLELGGSLGEVSLTFYEPQSES
jgi:hypothetical protein